MTSVAKDNVSYRLLNRLSNLVICSSCLRSGVVTPVPQMISNRHSLTNECVPPEWAEKSRMSMPESCL